MLAADSEARVAAHFVKDSGGRKDVGQRYARREIFLKQVAERCLDDTRRVAACVELRGQRLAMEDTLHDGFEIARIAEVVETREVVLQRAAVVRERQRSSERELPLPARVASMFASLLGRFFTRWKCTARRFGSNQSSGAMS